MKWLCCVAGSPVAGEADAPYTGVALSAKEAAPEQASKKAGARELVLEKQDSAFLAGPPADDYANRISQAYSTSVSEGGHAAALRTFGPPKPICNAARLENLEEIGYKEPRASNPQIQHIMQLMCTVFNTKSALVALVGDDSIWVHDAINFKTGDFWWRQSFCAHTLTPPNHQVMAIEDASADARFKHLPLVAGRQVLSYMGTPIVSSRGHRLGTVCFANPEPRRFDAETCAMLSNMGELVTRELEREWAERQQQQQAAAADKEQPRLLRAIDCFNDAVMFVDTSAPGWRVLHLNAAAETRLKLFGVRPDLLAAPAGGSGLRVWELFEANSAAEPDWAGLQAAAAAGRKFEVAAARLGRNALQDSAPSPVFGMTFRCAANDVVDGNTPAVGAPAHLPSTQAHRQYYFLTLSHAHGSGSAGSLNSISSLFSGSVDVDSMPFDDLELGPLLGKGGYGRVYRGVRDGEILAVKIVDSCASLRLVDGQPLEATICRDAQHPNIVRTIDCAATAAASDATSDGAGDRHDSAGSLRPRAHRAVPPAGQVWMLLEFCDHGCLQEASDKGLFLRDGAPHMPALLAVARDIASGMAFLHARGVAHGDLTGGNVLLAGDSDSPAGVTAKVADFGLARAVDVQSRLETRTYGTVTHMPPELLIRGEFSKAADTYALGVLLWEMLHGVRAWSSMSHAQVITAVGVNRRSLKFQPGAPAGYAALATALMAHDPAARPTFAQALARIEALQAEL